MDKSFLDIEQDEYVVYEKEDSVVLYKDEELEFFITNLNLVLFYQSSRMFKKPTYDIVKLAIADIKVINNIPQIKVEYDDYNECWNIVILFTRGIEKIGMYSDKSLFKKDSVERELKQLAEKISQLRMKGTIVLKKSASDSEDSNTHKTESIIDRLKKTPLSKSIVEGIAPIANFVKPKEKNITAQPKADRQYNFCQFCGAKKDENAMFCPSCGSPQHPLNNTSIKHTGNSFAESEKTIQEVFDTLNEEQKLMVYALVGAAMEDVYDD